MVNEEQKEVETAPVAESEAKENNQAGEVNETKEDNLSKTQSKAQRKEKELKNRAEGFFTSGGQFSQGHTGYLTFTIKS